MNSIELDTYGAHLAQNVPSSPADMRNLAESTLKAYMTVRSGVQELMKRYYKKFTSHHILFHASSGPHPLILERFFEDSASTNLGENQQAGSVLELSYVGEDLKLN